MVSISVNAARGRQAAALKLLCFPYAGGSADVFRGWSALTPSWLEPLAVPLPGRRERIFEPMPSDLDDLVAGLLVEGHLPTDEPYALLGISMGALIAFELARALMRADAHQGLRHFVAVSYPAPWRVRHMDLHRMNDDEFITALRVIDATPPAVLENDELMRLIMPTLRADFAVAERWRHRPAPPLPVPVTVVHGDADAGCTTEDAAAWQQECGVDGFTMHTMAGGHFFFRPDPSELVTVVARALDRARTDQEVS
ncbi:Surfactin synthase thioesterase subunit [Streptosporangium canum]|uniref:Surfactin synthase thioesterase subunit n=1 Tax=Streptosporangium canum TaxID=324952 RepID=A0A1I3MZF7_9ACTN|nr:alpha/beta fold hydrolase [Streptosporangium canum]SFJ02369.1 Surfactin synthase thioesterase subunit [Streptosporangium canum]